MAHDLAAPPDGLVVIEQRLRIAQLELEQAAAQAFFPSPQDSIAAEEITEARARLLRLHRETQAGLQHMILIGDVVAEVAEGLLDPAGVESVQATEPQAVVFAGLQQGIE